MHIIKNNENIDFKGIIVSTPKRNYEGEVYDFAFEVEDAYTSMGTHGYPEKGSHPSDSSFFSICYDMDYLPNGLFFNRTSGFTLEQQFGNDKLDYYKFDNMVDFCKWYLQKNGYTCNRPETTVKQETYIKKSAVADVLGVQNNKRNRLLEVSEYLNRLKEIEELKQSVDSLNKTEITIKLAQKEKELEEWLDQ